jgi:hypothetical protein
MALGLKESVSSQTGANAMLIQIEVESLGLSVTMIPSFQ